MVVVVGSKNSVKSGRIVKSEWNRGQGDAEGQY